MKTSSTPKILEPRNSCNRWEQYLQLPTCLDDNLQCFFRACPIEGIGLKLSYGLVTLMKSERQKLHSSFVVLDLYSFIAFASMVIRAIVA